MSIKKAEVTASQLNVTQLKRWLPHLHTSSWEYINTDTRNKLFALASTDVAFDAFKLMVDTATIDDMFHVSWATSASGSASPDVLGFTAVNIKTLVDGFMGTLITFTAPAFESPELRASTTKATLDNFSLYGDAEVLRRNLVVNVSARDSVSVGLLITRGYTSINPTLP